MRADRNREDVTEVLRHLATARDHSHERPAASSAAAPASSFYGFRRQRPKETASPATVAQRYVQAVLEHYLWLPGTPSVTSRHDRRCAQTLYRRGIALEVVHSAMVLAVARRTFRTGTPLPRVRAVHFFLPVIDELLECPCYPDYIHYLKCKLRPLAAAKAAKGHSSAGQAPTGQTP